jgi:hypothetical protein
MFAAFDALLLPLQRKHRLNAMVEWKSAAAVLT